MIKFNALADIESKCLTFFHKRFLNCQSLKLAWKLLIKNFIQIHPWATELKGTFLTSPRHDIQDKDIRFPVQEILFWRWDHCQIVFSNNGISCHGNTAASQWIGSKVDNLGYSFYLWKSFNIKRSSYFHKIIIIKVRQACHYLIRGIIPIMGIPIQV